MYSIVVVDDHILVSHAIAGLINTFNNFEVIYTCQNGNELVEKLQLETIKPHIILMDISMPQMNGIETTQFVKNNYPEIHVIALTAIENCDSIKKMLKAGAVGYLLKGMETHLFEKALNEVIENKKCYSRKVVNVLVDSITNTDKQMKRIVLKKQEKEFMTYACSELTYKEIANRMYRSPKTIDGYRNDLFDKLNIKNRTGLVLYAIKNKIFIP